MPIKDQIAPAVQGTSPFSAPTSILVLLRARDGESLADLLPYARPGAHVGIGRGVAVISAAEPLPSYKRAPVATLPQLEEHLAQVEALGAALRDDQAGAEAELGDAYQGAREDLAIWKRRALEAEEAARQKDQIIDRLTLEVQGEARMGEPYIPEDGQELRGAGPGAELLRVHERLIREVIQREAVCGGIIARAIAEGRP